MQIWVDADACPVAVKEILYRVAERLQLPVCLIANQLLRVPGSRFIRAVQVPAGMDAADHEIVRRMQAGDLVITNDIPLAADVLKKAGYALNPRGEMYLENNIGQLLATRKMLEEMRESGLDTGGPAAFSQTDRRNFANSLDTLLARLIKQNR